jgi:hypothetical protein
VLVPVMAYDTPATAITATASGPLIHRLLRVQSLLRTQMFTGTVFETYVGWAWRKTVIFLVVHF